MITYRLTHLSSVHPRDDVRIFHKQCRSIAARGYDVVFVVADGGGDESREGVRIVDVGQPTGRFHRILATTTRIFRTAVALDADVFHLHDPELIPVGLKLKRLGKKVLFDSHEDVPKQFFGKPYLGPLSQRIFAAVFSSFERRVCRRFDGIIAATPFIRDKFLTINPRTVDINNFPLTGELDAAVPWTEKQKEICYVGDISAARGIREVVRAFELLNTEARLNLVGRFSDASLKAEVRAYPGWSRVNERGYLDRAGVRRVLGRSMAGLVTLHPLPNYLNAQPTKMFEYMSSGIPVIASNFPFWREIVEGTDCGFCVDPLDPQSICDAIDRLVTNPDLARRMGENGRRAVVEQYNWSIEERKLLDFYGEILGVVRRDV